MKKTDWHEWKLNKENRIGRTSQIGHKGGILVLRYVQTGQIHDHSRPVGNSPLNAGDYCAESAPKMLVNVGEDFSLGNFSNILLRIRIEVEPISEFRIPWMEKMFFGFHYTISRNQLI